MNEPQPCERCGSRVLASEWRLCTRCEFFKAMTYERYMNVNMTLTMTPELAGTLETLADELNTTTSGVLLKAILLVEIASNANKAGKRFGVAAADTELETEIVGLEFFANE